MNETAGWVKRIETHHQFVLKITSRRPPERHHVIRPRQPFFISLKLHRDQHITLRLGQYMFGDTAEQQLFESAGAVFAHDD